MNVRHRSRKDVLNIPIRPSDPRPGNKPYYISPLCSDCGQPLVLADLLDDPGTPHEKIWHDEWVCPHCCKGIYLDWPPSEIVAIKKESSL